MTGGMLGPDGTVHGLEISKHWDEKHGRMMLILKNGNDALRDVIVEDTYPPSLSGVLCFAKSGGVTPLATASGGKITWKVPNLRPGEVKELVYTSLSMEVLNNPCMKKRPDPGDMELLAGMKAAKPSISSGGVNGNNAAAEETTPAMRTGDDMSRQDSYGQSSGRDTCGVAGTIPCRKRPDEGPGRRGVVIAIGAGKGGTGKTTFSINLGVALSEMGFKTVLMDADASMSNLAIYAGMDPQSMKATLHEVLSGEAEPYKAVYRIFNDNLRIVPSGLSIEGFLKMDRDLLDDVIEYFSSDADFIVIDTPAGYNKEVALSLLASDYLILVLNPDEGSMTDGIKVQEMARILDVRIMGIVLNRYDMKGTRFSGPQVEEYFGTQVVAMLPEDPDMRRKDKVPVVLASPASRTATEIYRVAEMLSGRRSAIPAGSPSFVTKLMEALFKG